MFRLQICSSSSKSRVVTPWPRPEELQLADQSRRVTEFFALLPYYTYLAPKNNPYFLRQFYPPENNKVSFREMN